MDSFIDLMPLLMLLSLVAFLFSGFPVAFVLAGTGILFGIIGLLVGEFPQIGFFNLPVRIFRTINGSMIYPAVPMLLFMGLALEKSGVARDMLLGFQKLLGRTPASLAIAMTILGVLLAPSAGLVGASVVTLAVIGLPTMLARGYHPSIATGSVAAAGTLGIILPPGVMLFILANQLRTQIGAMYLSTLLPGAILALLLIAYYLIRAWINPAIAPPAEKQDDENIVEALIETVKSLFLPLALIALVLGSILAGWATPTQSGAVGAAGSLVILAVKNRLTMKIVNDVVIGTVCTSSMVFFIIICAAVFSYFFNYFGGADMIADFMDSLGFDQWGVLFVILGIIFILGFFVDWIEITAVVLPVFLPILDAMDFSAHVGSAELVPIWLAVLIALILQTSFMTPPFGFALFFVKGSAPPEVQLGDIYRGVAPLILLQLLTIAAVIAAPKIAIYLPMMWIG